MAADDVHLLCCIGQLSGSVGDSSPVKHPRSSCVYWEVGSSGWYLSLYAQLQRSAADLRRLRQ